VKKAKVGAGNVAPVQGYLARFNQNSLSFTTFAPIAGGSVVSSAGILALGMTLYGPFVGTSIFGVGTGSADLSCLCQPGTNGKIDVPDSCGLAFDNVGASGHVVKCTDAVAIP
jgi:hypothetical protein